MKANRRSANCYPTIEYLEPRLPTGELLLGGLTLVGFAALGEPEPRTRGGVVRIRNLNSNDTGAEFADANDGVITTVVVPRDTATQSPVNRSNRDVQSGVIAPIVAPQRSRLPEQVDDAAVAEEMLPKNRSELRGPPGDVRRGPFNSIQINVDENGLNIVGDAANEPSIAVNHIGAGRRQQVVVGWRQFDTITSNFRQAGFNRSTNSGKTWETASVLEPGVFRSDPVLASSRNGQIYYSSLRTSPSFATDVFITENGGANWSAPNFSFGGDKQWITVDNTGGMGDGHLYQAWNTSGNGFNRSVNGGLNWSTPTAIPQRPVFGTMDVGADGALYIVGIPNQDFSQMVVAKSTDAQNPAVTPTFTTVTVPMGGSMGFGGGPNPGGLVGQAWIAVDRSDGPTHNNVYVLCSINPPGADPLEVYFVRSTDGGSTWSAPLRVNDDRRTNNAWQWFGTMSVAQNGRIDVVWNDTRHSLTDSRISETYYAYSTDGGMSFSKNIQLTPAWNSHVGWPDQNKIGDYYHMISENATAALAYSATFNGEQDVYFLRFGDCNNNRVHDGADIVSGASQDQDEDLIPDECE